MEFLLTTRGILGAVLFLSLFASLGTLFVLWAAGEIIRWAELLHKVGDAERNRKNATDRAMSKAAENN